MYQLLTKQIRSESVLHYYYLSLLIEVKRGLSDLQRK